MKVKNVIKGLMQKYELEEINIIEPDRVIYSGPVNGWRETAIDMVLYKKKIETQEVEHKIIFNNRKAFIFIAPIDAFYPARTNE